ncbi:cytochrome c oxidase assembly factor 3-like protein, mitochondrial [Platysternon megacephalum]|uniref:Cytochrome c oxidase assembly factor 3-like protein, mitochondrial n=1 Tax=Platysternon megacephalum TaxID=55544 RepID=A0A4D9EYZ7_9SAUR|nr:cytochrome c oxidase assembly factor 3-like protein, mitochondrial [Platysternon megacephalum]
MEAEEAAHGEPLSEDRRRLIPGAGRRRQGSLAAAVAQCLALSLMCTAGAYPSWVLVSGGDRRNDSVLGAVWAVHPRDPAPDSPLLGRAGGVLMVSIAVCCVLAILSGYGAVVLDFLGLRRGAVAAPLLHGLATLLAAGAAALCSCLFELVRSRLRTEKQLQHSGLSSTPGQSFFLSILACALAATATGLSCSASARVGPAAGLSPPGTARRRKRLSFLKHEGEGASDTEHSLPAWEGETDSRKETVVALVQGETEPGMAGSLRFIHEEIEPRLAGSLLVIRGETESQMEAGLPFIQAETKPQMEKAFPFIQGNTES